MLPPLNTNFLQSTLNGKVGIYQVISTQLYGERREQGKNLTNQRNLYFSIPPVSAAYRLKTA